jgi:hypothetical protein
VAGLFLAGIAVVLAGQWQEARPLLGRLSAPAVLGAMVAVLAGIWATFLSWRAGLSDLGAPLPLTAGMRVFFLGQLGKYLPGSIWPAVTQMRLGRDYQVPQRASGAAVVVFMLMVVGTGLLVGLPVVPLLGRHAADQYQWLVLALPLAMLLAAPPVLNRVIAQVLRVARRPAMPARLSLGGILRAAGWSILAWLLYGVQVFVLARRRLAAAVAVHRGVRGRLRRRAAAGRGAGGGRRARGRAAPAARPDHHRAEGGGGRGGVAAAVRRRRRGLGGRRGPGRPPPPAAGRRRAGPC